MTTKQLSLIGYAAAIAGVDDATAKAPFVLQQVLQSTSWAHWLEILTPISNPNLRQDELIAEINTRLAKTTAALIKEKNFFCVIGGDHSAAIGTWSGVYDALHQKGEIGLIWIDAHMDSHTPETTESGRIHGMPLASLLGFGYPTLTSILQYTAKLKPENICLIGVRSYESGEAALLKRLNARIYFMDEIATRGFSTVLHEAAKHVAAHTVGYGISLDIDSVDPHDAPGVDVPEPNGIKAKDLCDGLSALIADPKLLAMEIVEFNPNRDQHQLTEKLMISLLNVIAQTKTAN